MSGPFPVETPGAVFVAASLVLAVTPGPGVFYIVARTLAQGRAAGLASVGGVALGNLGSATAAAAGLAALLAISTTAFGVVKFLGAAYLAYLGVRTLRAGAATAGPQALVALGWRRIVADGFLVALLNPKTALFFAAFLPQFVPASATTLQVVALGVVFVLIAAVTDSCYALAAGAVQPRLARGTIAAKLGRYLGGGTLVGLGVLAALSGPRART